MINYPVPFSFTAQQPQLPPQAQSAGLASFIANNPLLSQSQQPATEAPRNASLDPLKLGQILGQKQGPMGLPPLDPVGGITNKMGTAGKILNPVGMLFGSGGLFG